MSTYDELLERCHELERFEFSEQEFEDYLDDIYEPVSICGMTKYQGAILRECDPIAFSCSLSEEEDRVKSDMWYELSNDIESALGDEEITQEEYDELMEYEY